MNAGIPRWLADRLGRGRSASLAVGLSVLLVGGGLTAVLVSMGDEDLGPGEARLRPDGAVEVSHDGGSFTPVTRDVRLATGDRVKVRSGKAVLELAGDVAVEMRAGSEVTVGGDPGVAVGLERGDLLVQVGGSSAVVDGGSAAVTVEGGVAKLRRSASLVAGVYEGRVELASAGQSLVVGRYRQAAVVGLSRLPDDVRPLTLDDGDEWDRTFLGGVLELDRRLVAFGRGFEALLPADAAVTPALYRDLLPDLGAAPLTEAMLAGRSAGENLIGLSLVALGEGDFADRFAGVFAFRDAGARWGLVAADQDHDAPDVVDTVEAAIDRAPIELAAPAGGGGRRGGGGGPGPSSPGTPPTATPPTGGGGGNGGGGGGGGTTTTTRLLPPLPGSSTTTTVADCTLKLGNLCVG